MWERNRQKMTMTFGGRGAAAEAAAEAEKRSDGKQASRSKKARESGRCMGLNYSAGKARAGAIFCGWAGGPKGGVIVVCEFSI